MKTIYNVQICRAIAAIIVLLEHGAVIIDPTILHGFLSIGWCGVDLFFILSGFIIFYVNHKNIGTPNKFKQYIGRRLCRIYPIYWLYTLTLIVLYFIVLRIKYGSEHIFHSLALYPFHTELGQYPIIPPAHTLVYELVFYMIFGVGILFNKRIFTSVMIVWLVCILLNLFTGFLTSGWILINVIVNPANIEFFYGCAIALMIIKKPFILSRFQAYSLLLTGIVLLVISWLTQLKNYGPLLNFHFLKFGIPFSIIVYAAALLESNDHSGKLKKLFIKLGDASYSIYLIHYTCLALLTQFIFSKIKFISSSSKLITGFVLIISFSYFAYKWVEQPIINFFNKKLR